MKKTMRLFLKNRMLQHYHKVTIKRINIIANNSIIPLRSGQPPKKIIFNLIYGMYGRQVLFQVLLAKALQVRGHDVSVLLCDNALAFCTTEETINRYHNDKNCEHCVSFSKDFFDAMKIPTLSFNDYISEDEKTRYLEIFDYPYVIKEKEIFHDSVNIWELSKCATDRYFIGQLHPNEDLYNNIFHKELVNSMISTKVVERLYESEKPDILVTIHQAYSCWGAIFQYMKKQGVNISTVNRGYLKNQVHVNPNLHNKINANYSKFVSQHHNNSLTSDESMELEIYLDKRTTGKEGDTSEYDFTNKSPEGFIEPDKYKNTFVLYANLPWDASLIGEDSNIAFDGFYPWIDHNIDFFKKHQEHQLIIKVHPARKANRSINTVDEYINENFELSPNIKIIPPVTNISPFSLFPYITACLTYNGTIGLESAVQGKPTILVGNTHYRNKGFTHDIITIPQYDKILLSSIKPLSDKQIQKARMYAYYHFIKKFHTLNLLINPKPFDHQYVFKSFNDLGQGKNQGLDDICDDILGVNS